MRNVLYKKCNLFVFWLGAASTDFFTFSCACVFCGMGGSAFCISPYDVTLHDLFLKLICFNVVSCVGYPVACYAVPKYSKNEINCFVSSCMYPQERIYIYIYIYSTLKSGLAPIRARGLSHQWIVIEIGDEIITGIDSRRAGNGYCFTEQLYMYLP